jgi:hypothetical protein
MRPHSPTATRSHPFWSTLPLTQVETQAARCALRAERIQPFAGQEFAAVFFGGKRPEATLHSRFGESLARNPQRLNGCGREQTTHFVSFSRTLAQIDANGRILEGTSSGDKVHVVEREVKRMEQEEDTLAREEADLRVSRKRAGSSGERGEPLPTFAFSFPSPRPPTHPLPSSVRSAVCASCA